MSLLVFSRAKDKKRQKTDDNWVRNISIPPLQKTEIQELSHALKHSVKPKRITTKIIVCSVEAVLSRQVEQSESTKDKSRREQLLLYNQPLYLTIT